MITTGEKVRVFRLLRFGGSRAEFARAAKLGLRTLGAVERDEFNHHYGTIAKIEAAIGCGLNDPDVEAAFAILADDEAKKEMVVKALAFLERSNNGP